MICYLAPGGQEMHTLPCNVIDLADEQTEIAVDLLSRFFTEEGFTGTRVTITANVARLLADPYHWIGLAWADEVAIEIVTVTTMLYIEWGRLGEIGDLYVIPSARRKEVAASLIDVAKSKCRAFGCSAVSVVITPEGEALHGLMRFYERFGFAASGRSIVTHVLS
jgi:GNAT superfamily N-acetyltransferase